MNKRILSQIGAALLALVLVLAAAPALADAVRGKADESPGPEAARRGLKRLEFNEWRRSSRLFGGWSADVRHLRYSVEARREAGRDVFRLTRLRTVLEGGDGAKAGAPGRADVVAECALSDAEASALEALLVKHELLSWDGYFGLAKTTLDGVRFHLFLEYADGRKAIASGGDRRYPRGYRAARDEIRGFLDDVLEKSGARTAEGQR